MIQQRPQAPTTALVSTASTPTAAVTAQPNVVSAAPSTIVVRPQQQQQLPTSVQTLLLGGKTVTLARPMMTAVMGQAAGAPGAAGQQLRPIAPPQQLVIVSQAPAGTTQAQPIQLFQSAGVSGSQQVVQLAPAVSSTASSVMTVTSASGNAGGIFRVPSTVAQPLTPTTVVVEASGIAGQPSSTKQVPQAVLVRT